MTGFGGASPVHFRSAGKRTERSDDDLTCLGRPPSGTCLGQKQMRRTDPVRHRAWHASATVILCLSTLQVDEEAISSLRVFGEYITLSYTLPLSRFGLSREQPGHLIRFKPKTTSYKEVPMIPKAVSRSLPLIAGALTTLSASSVPLPASACGNAEVGPGCAEDATWLLGRAVAEVKADKARALTKFSDGEDGFVGFDLYVFCFGPDGRVSAHPDHAQIGRNASDLKDANGTAFAVEMIAMAKEGKIAEVQYLWPRPGSDKPEHKTSWVTKVDDQVCGVGIYQ